MQIEHSKCLHYLLAAKYISLAIEQWSSGRIIKFYATECISWRTLEMFFCLKLFTFKQSLRSNFKRNYLTIETINWSQFVPCTSGYVIGCIKVVSHVVAKIFIALEISWYKLEIVIKDLRGCFSTIFPSLPVTQDPGSIICKSIITNSTISRQIHRLIAWSWQNELCLGSFMFHDLCQTSVVVLHNIFWPSWKKVLAYLITLLRLLK